MGRKRLLPLPNLHWPPVKVAVLRGATLSTRERARKGKERHIKWRKTLSRRDRMAPAVRSKYSVGALPAATPKGRDLRYNPCNRQVQNYPRMNFFSCSKPEYTRVLAVLSGQPWISAISANLKPW